MTKPVVPSYASTVAPYALTREPSREGATVIRVIPESPADDLGIEPGMKVLTVGGKPLTDMIVWMWEADGDEVDIEVFDPRDSTVCLATLERFPGEDWGLEFDGAVFDGMRTCVNACVFCFMGMLPKESRKSLSIRDDDYRLSFLQGNFVTLTNMKDDEVEDAIDKMLSPMNVSLHAITSEVRRKLIGRNAPRGIEVLERFMGAGIEIHAQIVLCPGLNDGDELDRSFSDDPEASRAVVRLLEPYQARARKTLGITRFQLSDEFYIDAGLPVPAAETYDGFPQFYDGIGMLRSFMDECDAVARERTNEISHVKDALRNASMRLLVISGEAALSTFERFGALFNGDGPCAATQAIENRYFGGNVNVTGLICSCDLLDQLEDELSNTIVLLPDVMFNYDGLTLDGESREHVVTELERRGARVTFSVPAPARMLEACSAALEALCKVSPGA